jgi:hypothetical protein
MTDMGVCWGYNLKNTNAHIGNFVVLPDNNKIYVSFADMGGMQIPKSIGSEELFLKIAHGEVESFKGDLLERTTISTSTRQPYRFFSDELRDGCFQSLKLGYYTTLKKLGTSNIDHLKPDKEIHPEMPPEVQDSDFAKMRQLLNPQ